MYEPLIEEIGNLRRGMVEIESKLNSKSSSESEDVYVKNLDQVKAYLREELGKVARLLNASLIKIANKPSGGVGGKQPNMIIPDSIEISNISELSKTVGALNTMIGVMAKKFESNIFNPEIKVNVPDVNVPEIKIPEIRIPEIRMPDVIVPEIKIPEIVFEIDKLIAALAPLKNISKNPNSPIAVRLSDGKKFIEQITSVMKKGSEQLATVVSTSYGLTKQQFKDAMAEIGYNRTAYTATKALSNGTAVQISATSVECKKVEISVTGGTVAVGFDNTVLITSGSEVGVIVYPGNLPYVIETDNLNRIWVSGASGRRVCYNYYV